MKEIKGHHVLITFVLGFGVIIAVNLTLAFNAVRTFPGLEVANSYVASQSFEQNRSTQLALGWDVSAWVSGDVLFLSIADADGPIAPMIEAATFGRATSVAQDQTPVFTFDGKTYRAPVSAGPGNWNLRLRARSSDGALFAQRIIVGHRE